MKKVRARRIDYGSLAVAYSRFDNLKETHGVIEDNRKKVTEGIKDIGLPKATEYADFAAGVSSSFLAVLFSKNAEEMLHKYSSYLCRKFCDDHGIPDGSSVKYVRVFHALDYVRRYRQGVREVQDTFFDFSQEASHNFMRSLLKRLMKENSRFSVTPAVHYDQHSEGVAIRWPETMLRPAGKRGRCHVYSNESIGMRIGRGGYRLLWDDRLYVTCDRIDAVFATNLLSPIGDEYKADFVGMKNHYPVHFTAIAKKQDNGRYRIDKILSLRHPKTGFNQ